jgi:toxin ParE1/3/4
MIRRRIEKKARFRIDLMDCFLYLGERDFDVGKRFVKAVREATLKLADMPGMGARRDWQSPHLQDLRLWPVKGFENYLIIYRPLHDGIEVHRVVHGARDIDPLVE